MGSMSKNRESSMHGFFSTKRLSPTPNDSQQPYGIRPQSFSRFSFHKMQQPGIGTSSSCQGVVSPKVRVSQRSTLSGNFPFMESVREDCVSDTIPIAPTTKDEKSSDYSKIHGPDGRLTGVGNAFQCNKDIASLDKINDPQGRTIVVAGKSHLGLYKFDEDYSFTQTQDYMSLSNHCTNTKFSNAIRRSFRKISTISDVKAGFHNHKNYIAICGTSTSLSIYDINRTSDIGSPLVATYSEHSRSINSVDFNMGQTNLIISGGQDGYIKVWDLRSTAFKNNRSDASFSSGSDSVRDVKWMPSYDFASSDSNSSMNSFNRWYKFASVNDSGLLLTYDLRQPGQVERKINAHSGPGLCMHWHPHMDYIITGGRDGKCALWYVGDKANATLNLSQGHSNTTGYSINTVPISTGYLETMINTAHPMTKLKFRPNYVTNVLNSIVATSSMGEDSDVSIYSLARKYIPKHILITAAPSLGFVWWDKNIIFNIDKQNIITTWDIRSEPTMLDNLPKSVVKWRDIDGDGLVFIDQEKGTYVAETLTTPDSAARLHHHKMSTNASSGLINPTNKDSAYISNSLFPAQHQSDQHTNFVLERPTISKTVSSLSAKITSPLQGNFGVQSASYHNSIASESPSTSGVLEYCIGIDSPALVSLDLPRILNSVRISRLPNMKKDLRDQESAANKQSVVEVFKFLSKELKFSYVQEKTDIKQSSAEDPSQSVDETEAKTKLMESIGISGHNTWATLIRTTTSHDTDSGIYGPDTVAPKKPDTSNSIPTDDSSDISLAAEERNDTRNADDVATSKLQKQNNHYIKLISMCAHNAETYAYIDDVVNFKLWLMIRDSLLWDLKQLTEAAFMLADDENNDVLNPTGRHDTTLGSKKSLRSDSLTSGYSSYDASELSSSADGQQMQQAIESISSNKALNGKHTTNMEVAFNGEKTNSDTFSTDSSNNHLNNNDIQKNLRELLELKQRTSVDEDISSENAVEIEDDGASDYSASGKRSNIEPSLGIPITSNRVPRTSFIDTLMTNLRSPRIGQMDVDNELITTKGKASTSLGSGFSKRSSIHSAESYVMGYRRPYSSPIGCAKSKKSITPNPNHFNHETMAINSYIFGLSPQKFQSSGGHLLSGQANDEAKSISDKYLPPWKTSRLIKQIFKHSVETGNILLTVTIILMFQTTFNITSTYIAKNTLAEFITVLHHYELFEISADLLKYCPWDDILGAGSGQSTIRLFCDKCGKLIINEHSKSKLTKEFQLGNPHIMNNFGYWYCDLCKKPSSLCVFCETPMKKLTMCLLHCGHEGHFGCFKRWFLDEGMTECPSGCSGVML
ncbi:Rtc1p Ecym_2024 [Eremothecium cymbalariae DBVPG|uniref:Restriction of telomere capping protein 1 n=1 Tax=Eremothecium cymbalariae (strain CBS 270.75 / DBVPG 7215 / KCTC 17166 / NRRL Y-17582) TaxID=931890 RepID=G8JNY3_ERECY|nr:Hypothetical protein Ecym_2024 [Eremothecium cymbalariae DBVPG\